MQSLCVNREKGTEKKVELDRSHILPNSKALSGYPDQCHMMDWDVPLLGAPVIC